MNSYFYNTDKILNFMNFERSFIKKKKIIINQSERRIQS